MTEISKQWRDPEPVSVDDALREFVGGHPLVVETLVRRGITDVESAKAFLNPGDYTPASPYDLPDMRLAVERVEEAIAKRQMILIWGDFDVDGQTSSALLVSGLEGLSATVSHYIPHRDREGHGVSTSKLEELLDDNPIRLIITCDTGIADHEAVDYANSRGVDVVITDHHQLPDELPNAYAKVNPQRLSSDHPLHTLPGVGVAYKLIEALYDKANRHDELRQFLDLVALGIVADVAPQVGDARYLLQRGLDVLRHTERLGLQELYQLAEVIPSEINAETIGFTIAPRLNALGRLDDANKAVEFLTTTDLTRAHILANMLQGLNIERKHESDSVYKAAVQQVENDPTHLKFEVLILSHPEWLGGVIGIVANRLVEQFNRPVILFREEDGIARGSARSIEGVDITSAITQNDEHLIKYGGHTAAAGMSLPINKIPDFRRGLSLTVKRMRQESSELGIQPTIAIDGMVALKDITLELVDDLERLAPFGAGNPALTLATPHVIVKSKRTIGRAKEHLRLTVEDDTGAMQDVLWWRASEDDVPRGYFDMAFTVSTTTFRGERQLQVTWVDARPTDEPITEFAHRTDIEIIDYRQADDPYMTLTQLTDRYPDAVVWHEGMEALNLGEVNVYARHELEPAPVLIIWTAPPHAESLQYALKMVNPETIVFIGIDPKADSVNGFLQRLAGIIKHALKARGGTVTWTQLAGLTAQNISTVRLGLDWMIMRGNIIITAEDGDSLTLAEGGIAQSIDKAKSTAQVATALQEASAYRAYFQKADTMTLVEVE